MRTYCFFSAQYLPHMGGVENFTYNLSKKLIEKGNKVIIVSSNLGNLPYIANEESIKVYRLPVFNLINGRYPVLKKNKDFKKIIVELNKEKIDVVIINTRFYLHSLFGARFARKKKIRSFVIEHGSSHLSVNNVFLDKIGAVFEHCLTFFVKRSCKEYYGVSNACVEWLKHFNIEAKGVIHNAIDLEKIQSLLKNTEINYRDKYKLTQNSIVITYTGRLIPEKGIPSLLSAFKKINNKNIYLFLAGDGPLYEQIEKMALNQVILLGRINFISIIDLLNTSDIFCLPSNSEGFSTSILEAAACKTYIVTTKQGGATELLLNDSYGIVLPDNEVDHVFDGLIKAIEMGKINRDIATEKTYGILKDNFTWDIICKQIIEIAKLPSK